MIKSGHSQLYDLFRQYTTKNLCYNQVRTAVYHRYKHGPTKTSNPEPDEKVYKQWLKEAFSREGWEFIKDGLKTVKRQRVDRMLPRNIEYNKTYVFEHFDNDEFLKTWKVGADSDSLHGYSSGELVRSPHGHALFRGILDTRIPDDGLTENSGFVGLMGPNAPKKKFFQFETSWDWRSFNTFEIRFRGDGRQYQLVINTASYMSDIQYYDNYAYPLYTRGGPYWQTLRIPFTKFVFNVKNAPQDHQSSLPAFKVKFVAINIHDRNDGPFALEIDYMGLRMDHYPISEITPYEQYTFAHIRYRQVSFGCDPPES